MRMFRWVVAALMIALLPSLAAAQSDGRISGTVRDSSNAFVAGAVVKVKNEKTGETRAAMTNNQGYFVVSPLRPSTYTITAEKPGFSNIEYTSMPLAVGQELALDFEFRPAGVEENVTVVATAPVLDISSARIGANVSEREVQSLPVNGRQMSQLMLQAPGSQNSGTGTWQDIRFSGRAVEQNVIKYDGIEGSAIIDSAPGNLNGEIPTPFKLQASLENVQEFRVESSNYPAEFGTGTGGQVSVVTKSGGNLFHGSVFEYLRNDKLDAPNYFDSTRNSDGSVLDELPKSQAAAESVRRLDRRSGHEGSGLLLRQLRGLPARRPARTRSRPCRAPRHGLVPYRRSPRCAAASWRRARSSCQGKSTNPDFDIAQLQADQKVTENSFCGPPGLPPGEQLVLVRARLPRPRHERSVRGRQRPRRPHHRQPEQRRPQPAGRDWRRPHQRVQVRLQRRPVEHRRERADGERHRLRRPRAQPEWIDCQQRHRRPGFVLWYHDARRARARQQRDQRTRDAVRPVLAHLRGHGEPRGRQSPHESSAPTSG